MKETFIKVGEVEYKRTHIKTHVVVADDDIFKLVEKYAQPVLVSLRAEGEAISADTKPWLFISERVVAITQGRAYKIDEIKVGALAKFLVKFVYKSPYGIGLGRPQTMQLAINEAGAMRVLFGAVISGILKLFGIRGTFYKIVGHGVNAIDGPCDYTLPPYNKYAVLGPRDPDGVATKLARKFGIEIVIIDANDLGVDVLGASAGVDREIAWAVRSTHVNSYPHRCGACVRRCGHHQPWADGSRGTTRGIDCPVRRANVQDRG